MMRKFSLLGSSQPAKMWVFFFSWGRQPTSHGWNGVIYREKLAAFCTSAARANATLMGYSPEIFDFLNVNQKKCFKMKVIGGLHKKNMIFRQNWTSRGPPNSLWLKEIHFPHPKFLVAMFNFRGCMATKLSFWLSTKTVAVMPSKDPRD